MNFTEFKKEANRANEAVDIAKANEAHLFAKHMGDVSEWNKTEPPVDTVVEYTYYLPSEWMEAFYKPYRLYIGYKSQWDSEMTQLDIVIATGEFGRAQADGAKLIWRPISEDLKDTYFSENEVKEAVEKELKKMYKETLMRELITDISPKAKKMIEYLGSNWSLL